MSWAGVVDTLFYVGALLAAGCIAYGGWLSISAPKSDPRNAQGVDSASEAPRPGNGKAAPANECGRKLAV
jgi:hypothetical protein